MATVYEKIVALCNEKGVSHGKMCADLGYSRNTMNSLKIGRSKTLKFDKAKKIADYFGVTVDYLLGNEKKPTTNDGGEFFKDEFIAFYGEVKSDLDDGDIEDLKTFMRMKAEIKRQKK